MCLPISHMFCLAVSVLQVALAYMLWVMHDDIASMQDCAARAAACARMPRTPVHIEVAELIAQHTGADAWKLPAVPEQKPSEQAAAANVVLSTAAQLQAWRAALPVSPSIARYTYITSHAQGQHHRISLRIITCLRYAYYQQGHSTGDAGQSEDRNSAAVAECGCIPGLCHPACHLLCSRI